VVFGLLALGSHGPLYRWTYGIPIWSSFRWPFKLLPFALFGVQLAAVAGLEIHRRSPYPFSRGFVIGLFVAVLGSASLVLLKRPSDDMGSTGAVLCGITGVLSLPGVIWISRRGIARALVLVCAVHLVGVTMLTMCLGFNTFESETYGVRAPAFAALDSSARVLPIAQEPDWAPLPGVQELGLYYAATACGFHSATGATSGLAPVWYRETLPSDAIGLLPFDRVEQLVGTDRLRSFNVRYYMARRDHPASLALLARHPDLIEVAGSEHVVAFEDPLVRPWVRFEQSDHGSGSDFPVAQAARVSSVHRDASSVRVLVEAPRGGRLVVASAWYPGWSARVDGRPVSIQRHDGAIMALEVTPGSREVRLTYQPPGLVVSGLAMLALAVGLATIRSRSGNCRADSRCESESGPSHPYTGSAVLPKEFILLDERGGETLEPNRARAGIERDEGPHSL